MKTNFGALCFKVSWIRKRDLHILTAGTATYTSDQRFQVLRPPGTSNWTLQIKYPQVRDSGVYECQINTEPKMSLLYTLNIVGQFNHPIYCGQDKWLCSVYVHWAGIYLDGKSHRKPGGNTSELLPSLQLRLLIVARIHFAFPRGTIYLPSVWPSSDSTSMAA